MIAYINVKILVNATYFITVQWQVNIVVSIQISL